MAEFCQTGQIWQKRGLRNLNLQNFAIYWMRHCVFKLTDGETDDHEIFHKLVNFVLGRLMIAHSTAAVERTFSIISCFKSKLSNRISTSTLEAILRCRTYLYNRGKCCKSFEVTAPMLSHFTCQIYGPGEENRPTPSVAVREQDLSIKNEITYYLPPLHDLLSTTHVLIETQNLCNKSL